MQILPDPSLPWPLPYQSAVVPLAISEGCRLRAYKHFPREPWTCGWGETDGVGPATQWTQAYADQRFCDSMAERVHAVMEVCTVAPNENELAALVQLAYNIGMGWEGKRKPPGVRDGLRQSTVLRQHNAGNKAAAAAAFRLWNKVQDDQGRLVDDPGLTARRLREAAQYLQPVEGVQRAPMPQAVEPERPLSTSKIATSSSATVATGAAGVLASLQDQLQPVRDGLGWLKGLAADLGMQADWLPWALLIALGGYTLWARIQQRREGVA